MAAKFGVFVDKEYRKLPTINWLPKLHKMPYKSRLIANSSSCKTTEFHVLALVRWPPCELNNFCTSTTAESEAKIWYQ